MTRRDSFIELLDECIHLPKDAGRSEFEINSSKWQICHLKITFATYRKGR